MVAAPRVERELDDLIVGLAVHDLAALRCDLPGNNVISRASVESRPFASLADTFERGWSPRTLLRGALGDFVVKQLAGAEVSLR